MPNQIKNCDSVENMKIELDIFRKKNGKKNNLTHYNPLFLSDDRINWKISLNTYILVNLMYTLH